MTIEPQSENINLLKEAQNYLSLLSSEKLKVAIDFLAYLKQKEEIEATEELLNISNFENELQEAEKEAESGEVISFKSIRRNV
jgi:hypothetical protein